MIMIIMVMVTNIVLLRHTLVKRNNVYVVHEFPIISLKMTRVWLMAVLDYDVDEKQNDEITSAEKDLTDASEMASA